MKTTRPTNKSQRTHQGREVGLKDGNLTGSRIKTWRREEINGMKEPRRGGRTRQQNTETGSNEKTGLNVQGDRLTDVLLRETTDSL